MLVIVIRRAAVAAVFSASVKRLVVLVNLPDSKEEHDCMWFDTPSLLYLDYSTYVCGNHVFTGFDSLVEARLSIRLWVSTTDYDYSDSDDDGDGADDDDYDEPFPIKNQSLLYMAMLQV